jgi:UDP-N-acetylmuramoyl-tripeptide--D-alanyl-D-alanine ligase
MDNIIARLIYSVGKPSTVVTLGDGRECSGEAIHSVLSKYFSAIKIGSDLSFGIIGKKILISKNRIKETKDQERILFLAEKSSKPIIVLTHFGQIAAVEGQIIDRESDWDGLKAVTEKVPESAWLVYNSDSPMLKKAASLCKNQNKIGIGFNKEADFRASDIRIGKELNFKANVKGSIIPVWLSHVLGKEQIYSALTALAVGKIFELNLIQTTEAIRSYRSVSGRMRIIKGSNGLTILDNTESESCESELEALEILGRMQCFGRKIAVLSDAGMGRDSDGKTNIEETALKTADLLFETDLKNKVEHPASDLEKIFRSDMIDGVISKLKTTVRDRDLILVGGSQESDFRAIVRELGN